MAATGYELAPRTGTDTQPRRKYRVENAADEDDALDWIAANAPAAVNGFAVASAQYEEDEDSIDEVAGTSAYDFQVNYGQSNDTARSLFTGQVDYEFSFQAQPFRMATSLETIEPSGTGYAAGEKGWVFDRPNSDPAPDFEGAVGVVNDGGKQKVEGLDIRVPPAAFTIVYYPLTSVVGTPTSSYVLAIEAAMGTVNSDAFKTRPAGSLMLVSASGGARNDRNWQLRFGFAYSPNRTNIPVGNITVGAKDGMDILWPYYEAKVDTLANNRVIQRPAAAYVERAFYRTAYSGLAIP